MNSTEKQKLFLKKIEDILPHTTSLLFELMETLGISQDSAYRRKRCETFLGFDEIAILCEKYSVSFDALNQNENTSVLFNYSKLENSQDSFKKYLKTLLADIEQLLHASNRKVVFACKDIPIFYHFFHPAMTDFKVYYWLHSILGIEIPANSKYIPGMVDKELIDLCTKMFNIYSQIPCVEIWTETTVQSAVKQIEYFWETGKFESRESALQMCEILKNEIDLIQQQSSQAGKVVYNSEAKAAALVDYKLYYSDIEISTNCILVEVENRKSLYFGHLTFGYLNTSNSAYFDDTKQWLDVIQKKAMLISGTSEKFRYSLFKKYFNQVAELTQRIENE